MGMDRSKKADSVTDTIVSTDCFVGQKRPPRNDGMMLFCHEGHSETSFATSLQALFR